MDWNWFFSSTAQSAAAIVGIFGAFIVTKIVGNQVEFARKRRRTSALLNESRRYKDRLRERYFSWYNERQHERDLRSLWERLEEDEEHLEPVRYYDEIGFSPFIDKNSVLDEIAACIATERESRARPPATTARSSDLGFSPLDLSSSIKLSRLQSDMALTPQIREERELIDKLVTDTYHHVRSVQTHFEEVSSNPESSRLIRYAIVLVLTLFYVSVVYPLSFLPVNPASPIHLSLGAFIHILLSLKGLILASLTVLFSSILLTFLWINETLRHPKDLLDSLSHFAQPRNYSKYLRIYDDNLSSPDQAGQSSDLAEGSRASDDP